MTDHARDLAERLGLRGPTPCRYFLHDRSCRESGMGDRQGDDCSPSAIDRQIGDIDLVSVLGLSQ